MKQPKGKAMKVKVLNRAFRDKKADYVKRRPGVVFETSKERAQELIDAGWVEEYLPMGRGAQKRAKQAKAVNKDGAPKEFDDKSEIS